MSTWFNITIDNLGEIITGYTPPTKETKYFGDKYPFITPTDITLDSRTVQTERFLSEKGYEYNKNRLLPPNSVCVTCIASIGKICMTTVPSVTNQQINSIVVNQDKYDPYFVYYLLGTKTDIIESVANRATTPIVNKSTFASINVCVPLLPTQRKIANFLDCKTEKIDELIGIKERRIELLQEQRTALINQVVTKGLDPNVKMKPSGVEWIEEIPRHWEVIRLRYLGTLQNGISKDSNSFGLGYPFLSYGDVYNSEIIPTQVEGLVKSTKSERERYSVKETDVFFTRTSETIEEIGIPSTCMKTIENCVFSGFLIRFRNTSTVLTKEFSKYYFPSHLPRIFLAREVNIVTRSSLSQELLKRLPVLLPSQEEQIQIANFLDHKTQQIDELITAEHRKIELLKEYRQSLISEVVTGKIDVRNEV